MLQETDEALEPLRAQLRTSEDQQRYRAAAFGEAAGRARHAWRGNQACSGHPLVKSDQLLPQTLA